MIVAMLPGAAPIGALDVSVEKLRSAKGVLRVCLTFDPKNFPACVDDARAITRTVPAGERSIRFEGLPYGGYAMAIIHDENDNAKLDTFMGIPREGFGFSRNPAIGFGAPRFAAARFDIDEAEDSQRIKMRYLL